MPINQIRIFFLNVKFFPSFSLIGLSLTANDIKSVADMVKIRSGKQKELSDGGKWNFIFPPNSISRETFFQKFEFFLQIHFLKKFLDAALLSKMTELIAETKPTMKIV